MPIEGLDASQELAIVSATDQHLRVVLHGIGQKRQRTGTEFFLLALLQFLGRHFLFGLGENRCGRHVSAWISRIERKITQMQ